MQLNPAYISVRHLACNIFHVCSVIGHSDVKMRQEKKNAPYEAKAESDTEEDLKKEALGVFHHHICTFEGGRGKTSILPQFCY